jgi:hypothetical protein
MELPMLKSSLAAGVALLLAWMPCRVIAACGHTSVDSDPVQIVDAQFAAYNAHDLDAFAACYADDVSVVDPGSRQPLIKGKAAFREAYAFLNKPSVTVRVEIVNRMVNGPIVIDREHVLGLPPGKHAPDVIAVYEVRQGKIVNAWFPPRE